MDITYLELDHVRALLEQVLEASQQSDEPYPEWSTVDQGKLASALAAPRQSFGGVEMYPSLEMKAAVLLYRLAKAHALPNANKRIALLSTLLFLACNDRWCNANWEQIRAHVVWIAASESMLRTEALDYVRPYLGMRMAAFDEAWTQ